MISKFKDFNCKIYFAHPKSTYGTNIELDCIKLIIDSFKSCDIVNPADYQDKFKAFKSQNSNYMLFFKNLISSCDKLVFLPFDDGMVGFGIIYEIDFINPSQIYEINLKDRKLVNVSLQNVKSRGLNFEQTSERNKNFK